MLNGSIKFLIVVSVYQVQSENTQNIKMNKTSVDMKLKAGCSNLPESLSNKPEIACSNNRIQNSCCQVESDNLERCTCVFESHGPLVFSLCNWSVDDSCKFETTTSAITTDFLTSAQSFSDSTCQAGFYPKKLAESLSKYGGRQKVLTKNVFQEDCVSLETTCGFRNDFYDFSSKIDRKIVERFDNFGNKKGWSIRSKCKDPKMVFEKTNKNSHREACRCKLKSDRFVCSRSKNFDPVKLGDCVSRDSDENSSDNNSIGDFSSWRDQQIQFLDLIWDFIRKTNFLSKF